MGDAFPDVSLCQNKFLMAGRRVQSVLISGHTLIRRGLGRNQEEHLLPGNTHSF